MTSPIPRVRRAYVETYGCQMNIADGELMEGVLDRAGYEIVSSPEEADVVLVNTCAIREHAESRVIGRVGQLSSLKRERPDLLIAVTGCMAQRMGEPLLKRAPYVDLVVGPDGYRALPAHLERLFQDACEDQRPRATRRRRRLQLAVLELDPGESYQGLEQRRRSGPSAWVPIQRGCDHRCTFCIVPYVRGPEKNRAPDDVLDEIRRLAEGDISEVTLLGQTVNSYRHGEWSFARLLREVGRVDGIRRVRFTSPHPGDVTDELVDVMGTEPAVCEQLHLPVQSGNDRTLKRMVRRYTVAEYLGIVEAVREAVPDIALSTDIIVGFPGRRSGSSRTRSTSSGGYGSTTRSRTGTRRERVHRPPGFPRKITSPKGRPRSGSRSSSGSRGRSRPRSIGARLAGWRRCSSSGRRGIRGSSRAERGETRS